MKPDPKYDGAYLSFRWLAGGVVIVAGEWALAYSLYGTKRDLFEQWRERQLSIPLVDIYEIDLRDARGISTREQSRG